MNKNVYALLSEREEQVLLLSTKGLTDKEIAKKLNLSIATVNTYWVRIRTKLGGANRAELVASALHKNAEETLTAKETENQRLISEVVRRAEAEKALRESQSRLQAIIDGTPVVVFIKDLQGRYTLVNKEFEALLRKERRELLGKRDYDIFGTEIGEEYRQQDQRVIETGEPVESEVVVQTPDGPRYFLSVKFGLINTEGTLYAVCGFAREITSRIEFEQKLQESEQRYKALIENSGDVITLLDAKGTILYTTPSIERVLGYKPDEITGQNAFQYIARDDLARIKKDFDNLVANSGSSIDSMYKLKGANGNFRVVEGHGRNMMDEAGVGAIVLNYRDITERHLNEQRLSAQYAVARVLSESVGIEQAAPEIAKALCQFLSFDFGGVWLQDASQKLQFQAAWHDPKDEGLKEFAKRSKESITGDEAFPGLVRQEKKALWESDFQTPMFKRAVESEKSGLKSAVGFPILAGEEALGVVEFFSKRNVPADEGLLNVLSIIGHQIGQYMKRKKAEAGELQLTQKLSDVNLELNQSVAAIEEERRRYRDLFEHAPDGYVVTDLKGKILEANQAALDLFGCEENDCVGKILKDFVVQDLKNAFSAGFSNLADLDTLHEWELKLRPVSSPVFDASISVKAVRDVGGNATAYRWLIRDISKSKFAEHELKSLNESLERRVRTRTIELEESNLRLQEEIAERKRAEEDLLNSHQFVHNVMECSLDGIMGFDRQFKINLWNRSMEELSGLSREDVLGQPAFEILSFLGAGDQEPFKRALLGESAVSRNRAYCFEQSGKKGHYDAHFSPMRNDRNEIIGGLAVVRQLQGSNVELR